MMYIEHNNTALERSQAKLNEYCAAPILHAQVRRASDTAVNLQPATPQNRHHFETVNSRIVLFNNHIEDKIANNRVVQSCGAEVVKALHECKERKVSAAGDWQRPLTPHTAFIGDAATTIQADNAEEGEEEVERFELLEVEPEPVEDDQILNQTVDATKVPPIQPKPVFGGVSVELEDGDDSFEYIIVPKPKRRSHTNSELSAHNLNLFIPSACASPPQSVHSRPRRQLPTLVPILGYQNSDRDCEDQEIYNQKFKARARATTGWENPSYRRQHIDDYFITDQEAGPNRVSAEEDEYAPMGLMSKLKDLLNYFSHSDEQKNNSRKRKFGQRTPEANNPREFKYRRVDSHFPDYIGPQLDDEIGLRELRPATAVYSQRNNENQALSQGLLYTNLSSAMSSLPQRRSLRPGAEPPQLRKSMFAPPETTHKLIKNTPYADIEFSDDDEAQLVRGFGIGGEQHADLGFSSPKSNICQIPNNHRAESPALEARAANSYVRYSASNSLGKPFMPKLDSWRKPTYAETLKQNMHLPGSGVRQPQRPLSTSGSSTGAPSSREFNGYGQSLHRKMLGATNVHSILVQERESDDRDKYQQLLQQMMPRLYGVSSEDSGAYAKPTKSASMQNRSVLKNRKSLLQPLEKRPPLSSTINLTDDDDEQDVGDHAAASDYGLVLKGITRRAASKAPATIVLDDDDDDISEIIDLDADEQKMVHCLSKYQRNTAPNTTNQRKKQDAVSLPHVEPVNTLKDRIATLPYVQDNWLQSMRAQWERKRQQNKQELNEAQRIAQKKSQERSAAELGIQERLRNFQIVDPDYLVFDDFTLAVEDEPEVFELNSEQQARIQAAICGQPDQVLVSKFSLNVTRRDIHTLLGTNWLNDEVINFYMNLLTERGEQRHETDGLPRVYAMNTFFVQRLLQAGHAGVKRWTRKVDIFAKDVIPVPVHVGGVHWCMAIIHMRNRTIKYYDSMGSPNPSVLKALEQYLRDESLDKRKQPFDTDAFEIESVRDVPRQMNGSDCGVFSCMFAEYITRDKQITFTQQNMEYFRHKMILEIVQGDLIH